MCVSMLHAVKCAQCVDAHSQGSSGTCFNSLTPAQYAKDTQHSMQKTQHAKTHSKATHTATRAVREPMKSWLYADSISASLASSPLASRRLLLYACVTFLKSASRGIPNT